MKAAAGKVKAPASGTQRACGPKLVRDVREQIAILRSEMLNTMVNHTDAVRGLDVREAGRNSMEAMTLALSNIECDLNELLEGVSQ